jgi:hypothetical protein
LDDPILGPLEYCGRMQWKKRPPYDCWQSVAPIDLHGQRVNLHVFVLATGPDPAPLDAQRRLFAELLARYPALRADMEQPMFAEYQAIREAERPTSRELDVEFPPLDRPSDIWRVAHLSTVDVQGFEGVDLNFLYEVDWADEEHVLSVHVRDWKVVGVGKEG